ncbi:MAG: glycosyltransferase family A protein [Planctomycetota bacterium]
MALPDMKKFRAELEKSKQEDWDSLHHETPHRAAVTLFAVPKPFGSDNDHIQLNAIRSWKQLEPAVEILLIGNEKGIREVARDLGVRYSSDIRYNDHGTPLVNSAFDIARRDTNTPYLAYINSDIILTPDFVTAMHRLIDDQRFAQFVAIGKRIDLDVQQEIDFAHPKSLRRLIRDAKSKGRVATQACKEYFIFNRDLYQNLPEFAIGRGNWDNWMVYTAKKNRVPVIETSSLITAVHQNHDYSHIDAGRYQCYVSGDEASRNMELAGGRHIISGSTPTWRITDRGIRKEPMLIINPAFWADVPRFSRLVWNLIRS